MDKEARCALYEKIYFAEIERRDKINARLTLPFAAFVTLASLLSFLLNSPDTPRGILGFLIGAVVDADSVSNFCSQLLGASVEFWWAAFFWLMFTAAALTLLVSAWFFRKAWFGHTDQLMPAPGALEELIVEMEKMYENYNNPDELVSGYFKEYLFMYYVNCSSANSINNDKRSYNVYRATAGLTLAAILTFWASIPYYLHRHLNGASHEFETTTTTTPAGTDT